MSPLRVLGLLLVARSSKGSPLFTVFRTRGRLNVSDSFRLKRGVLKEGGQNFFKHLPSRSKDFQKRKILTDEKTSQIKLAPEQKLFLLQIQYCKIMTRCCCVCGARDPALGPNQQL